MGGGGSKGKDAEKEEKDDGPPNPADAITEEQITGV